MLKASLLLHFKYYFLHQPGLSCNGDAGVVVVLVVCVCVLIGTSTRVCRCAELHGSSLGVAGRVGPVGHSGPCALANAVESQTLGPGGCP